MSCPHCEAQLPQETAVCGHCGFDVNWVRRMLGAEWVRLERLTDPQECLTLEEQRHLEIVLDEFERNFPQCFVAVYFGKLPSLLTSRDLGFWLLNHGAFPTQQMAKRNDYGIALVVDVSRQEAAITLGYALEGLISESELKVILNASGRFLGKQRHGTAVERMISQLASRLRRAGTRQNLSPGGWGWPGNLGLQTLRQGHQPSHKSAQSPGSVSR